MTVNLITGSNGFCGLHLARRLRVEKGVRIVGVDVAPTSRNPQALDDYLQADLCEPEQIKHVLETVQPDFVFHLAGVSSGKPSEIYRANFLAVLHLLEAVRCFSRHIRLLLVGSASEYGNVAADQLPIREDTECKPGDTYGASKHAMTLTALHYAQHHHMKLVIARPFNIVGTGIPATLLIGAVLRRAKEALKSPNEPVITIGNLDSERDFVAVDDVIEAYLRMMSGDLWGQVFNLCSGKPYSVRFVVATLLSHSPRPIRLQQNPSLFRPSDPHVIYGDWSKAHSAFGFTPSVPLETVLHQAWTQEFEA